MATFFLIEWVENYINTPRIELTFADEALFYLALLMILTVVIGGIWLVGVIVEKIKSK